MHRKEIQRIMRAYIVVIGFFILTLSLVHADAIIEITEVKINDGLTHEVSNDTNYFGPNIPQNATVKVTVNNTGDFNAQTVIWLNITNESGDSVYLSSNHSLYVLMGGSNSTTFVVNISNFTSANTGRYNITVNLEYTKNSTDNETINDTSEYINLVYLEMGEFRMEHSSNDTAKGDIVRFLQTVRNPGSINATAEFEITIYYDKDGDGFNQSDLVTDISGGGVFVVGAGETVTKTFIWEPEQEGCEYSDPTRWRARSWFRYGYSYYNGYLTPKEIKYINNITVEYLKLEDERMDFAELAPGDQVRGLVYVRNWGVSNATLHEAMGWIEDEDGNVIMVLSPHYTTPTVYQSSGNASICPLSSPADERQLTFTGNLPADISVNKSYKLIMAIDYGVPRGENGNFNKNVSVSFEVVKARINSITKDREEVPRNGKVKFTAEVENLGKNKIDDSGTIYIKIYNDTLGYSWSYNTTPEIEGNSKKNHTFEWSPSSDVPLGSYNVKIWYEFGLSGKDTKFSNITVVYMGVKDVNSPSVAPYDSTLINVTLNNVGPTNATLESIRTWIDCPSNPIEIENITPIYNVTLTPHENKSFLFNYTFNPDGITNGTYSIKVNLSYGGIKTTSAPANINLLPVGIKSYSLPELATTNSPFNITILFKNIAESNVTITLNISANGTTCNYTNLNITNNSEMEVIRTCTLNSDGIYNITINVNYSGTTSQIQRYKNIEVNSSAPEIGISNSDIEITPSSPTDGQTVTINVTLHNFGNKDAQDIKVVLFVDGNETSNKTASIRANSENNTIFQWVATQGTHEIKVIADYENKYAEGDESNNSANVTLTVTSAPSGGGISGGAGGGEAPSAKVTVIEAPSYIPEYAIEGGLTQTEVIELIKDARLAYADRYYIEDKVLAGVLAPNDVLPVGDDLKYEFPTAKSLRGDVYEAAAKYFNENTFGARIIVIARGELEADCLVAARFAK
ncbi:MAG: hypothetical protein DRN88_00005, partial [Candidatus Hydrothermarchaeota archaeon]